MRFLLKISECMKTVKEWSRVNGLKLNGSKTEFLHISSRYRATVPITSINLDGTLIKALKHVETLVLHLMISSQWENLLHRNVDPHHLHFIELGRSVRFLINKRQNA